MNYHFQDKAELYAAVLRRLAEDGASIIPPDSVLVGSAEERLVGFVRYLCNAMGGRKKPTWEKVLMAREMAEPTAALTPVFEQVLRPLSGKLSSLIAELLGRPPTDQSVGLATASIIGQCVYYIRFQNVFGRMHPQLGDHPKIDLLARYIADFSLAGIRGQAKVW